MKKNICLHCDEDHRSDNVTNIYLFSAKARSDLQLCFLDHQKDV